jgi:hypothetical protein
MAVASILGGILYGEIITFKELAPPKIHRLGILLIAFI